MPANEDSATLNGKYFIFQYIAMYCNIFIFYTNNNNNRLLF